MKKSVAGIILHNARENFSYSVVFTDGKNELWNDSKQAYKIFRNELEIRSEAYTKRTKQKLQKNTATSISAVVNLEYYHTLKDLEELRDYLEKEFGTKVFQMAIHRDEGKLINKKNPKVTLVSGKTFFLNPKNELLYHDKEFTNLVNLDEWTIEKNYHAHIEMMGIDEDGNSLRKKMNIYKLSKLQDFVAQSLNMERGNNNVLVDEDGKVKRKNTKTIKRKDPKELKEEALIKNELNLKSKKEKNKIIKQANELINNEREEKKRLKEDLDFVKNEFKSIREMLKGTGATREDFKKIDELNKQLQNDLKNNDIDLEKATEEIKNLVIDLKNNDIDLEKATEEIKNLVIDLKLENKTKDEKVKELTSLAYSNVLYNNTNDRVPYKVLNQDKKKKLKEKDELIENLNEKIKDYDSQISHIENLQKQIDDLLFEMEEKISQIERIEKANSILRENNEVLKNENKVLADENIKLKEIINSRANMSDLESLKEKNKELEKLLATSIDYTNIKLKEIRNTNGTQTYSPITEEKLKELSKAKDKRLNNESFEQLNKNLNKFVGSKSAREENYGREV